LAVKHFEVTANDVQESFAHYAAKESAYSQAVLNFRMDKVRLDAMRLDKENNPSKEWQLMQLIQRREWALEPLKMERNLAKDYYEEVRKHLET
jgi:hypothetical protein